MCYIIKVVPFSLLVLNTMQNHAAIYMYWNCRLLKHFCGTGVLLVQFYLYLIFDTRLQYREWWKIGLSHVVSRGAITTPSLAQAQAPGVSPTWRQCTASYFSAISFLKDHYSTHRPNTILKTSITNQEPTYFQKPTSHFKILGTMNVTRSTSHSEDP